jgi:dissimilatory sulfite reductase (desulfoviridin) alpha/beta subunit
MGFIGGDIMAYSRIVGQNIELMMQKKGIQASMVADKLGYSEIDIHRIKEGVLLINGNEIQDFAEVLDVETEELTTIRDEDQYRPLLHCMGSYKNVDNKDKILDFIDLYISLEEAFA